MAPSTSDLGRLPRSRRRRRAVLSAALALGLLATGCSHDGREMREPNESQFPATTVRTETTVGPMVTGDLPGSTDALGTDEELEGGGSGFVLTGPWPRGGPIPERHTCDGEDLAPTLRWFGVPDGTVALAILVTDLDANGFVHWVIGNLDADRTVLPEDVVPPGAVQATNSAGTLGWTGPCPPEGESHRYSFRLHALDQQIELPDGAPAAEFVALLDATTLATASYEGRYPES